jgi:hypothetical protein
MVKPLKLLKRQIQLTTREELTVRAWDGITVELWCHVWRSYSSEALLRLQLAAEDENSPLHTR